MSQVVACGAEAVTRQNEVRTEGQGWRLAKNFKLRLHPAAVVERNQLVLDGARWHLLCLTWHLVADQRCCTPSELPLGVRLEDVYVDFMQYIVQHTRSHLKSTIGEHEQDFLLNAAVTAGLVDDTAEGKSHVYFVEEAEASARYCVSTSTTSFILIRNLTLCTRPERVKIHCLRCRWIDDRYLDLRGKTDFVRQT